MHFHVSMSAVSLFLCNELLSTLAGVLCRNKVCSVVEDWHGIRRWWCSPVKYRMARMRYCVP